MIRPTPSKYGPPPVECPVTECLRFLSATWTPDILWFLREPRRFGDLKRDLSGISAKVLTDRLRELDRRRVVRRTIKTTSPQTVEYSLSELGRRFLPLIEQISVLGAALKHTTSSAVAAVTGPVAGLGTETVASQTTVRRPRPDPRRPAKA